MRFTTRVAIQTGTEIRDSVGGVSYDYTPLPEHTSLPATILPYVDETRQERFTMDTEHWSIILGGHYPAITPSMWVAEGDDRYEITRVSTTKGRRVTTVLARRPSL